MLFICYRDGDSLHLALNSFNLVKIQNILKPGSEEMKAATEIMHLMQKTEQLQYYSTHLTPLEAALRLGNYNICKRLIDEGAISLPINKNKHLLRHAFEGGNFKVAKLLLKAGASFWLEFEHKLPLYFALNNKSCCEDIVKTMVEAGFPPNEIINKLYGQTALHIAAKMNHPSVVEYLLSELKLDPDVRDILGQAPIHYATENNNNTITEMLVIYGAKIDIECYNNFTPLFYMIAHGKLSTVKQLLSLGSNIQHVSGQTMSLSPLHFATALHQLKIVKLLLEREANVDWVIPENRETVIHTAARAKCDTLATKIAIDCIIELLIKEKANLSLRDAFGWTPLQVAVRSNNTSLAKVLISNGSQLNEAIENEEGSQIPFHTVATTCNKELINACLEYGGDYLKQNDEGLYPAQAAMVVTMLHAETCRDPNCKQSSGEPTDDCTGVFKTFLRKGFPLELLTKINWGSGGKPICPKEVTDLMSKQLLLFTGVRQNQLKHVERAIEQKAEIKACSVDMPYPLHFLASKGSSTILSMFLARGVNVNALNAKGKTPLHLAAEFGHQECCMILLGFGAVYNPTSTKCPQTPLQLAEEKKHENIVNMFKDISRPFRHLKRGNFNAKSLRDSDNFLVILNCCNRKGQTLLGRAIANDLKDTVQELMTMRISLWPIT